MYNTLYNKQTVGELALFILLCRVGCQNRLDSVYDRVYMCHRLNIKLRLGLKGWGGKAIVVSFVIEEIIECAHSE